MTETTKPPSGSGYAPGAVLAERYELVDRIAAGGMAEVWHARDQVLDRRVAIKLMHRHLADDEAFAERFYREAVAVARIAHPGIISIFDTFNDDGHAGIVMELVEGESLRERLDRSRTLEPGEVIELGAQLAEAIDHAHHAGVVHRDIKPGNIMLASDGRVLLTDFGIAKAMSDVTDLTAAGTMIGTAKYLAPEQVEAKAVDGRSDIYALGAVLYEALCGRPPFQGDSDVSTALARLNSDPHPPRRIRAGVPRDLEAVIMRALGRAPADRQPTAKHLRDELTSCRATDADQTTSLASPAADRTTVRHAPATSAPTFAESERAWLLPTLVIVLMAGGLIVAGVLFSQTDTGQRVFEAARDAVTGDNQPAERIGLAGVRDFDPFGDDRSEHRERAQDAVDNNQATSWITSTYQADNLQLIKPGVGIYVRTADLETLARLEVDTATRGWSAEVYVATFPDAVAEDLASWGSPVTGKTAVDGSTSFDLGGREGNAVLLWFTELGQARRASVTEMRLFAG